jgi:hypothetical protein
VSIDSIASNSSATVISGDAVCSRVSQRLRSCKSATASTNDAALSDSGCTVAVLSACVALMQQ